MEDDARRPLEELHRELARQDEIWSRAKEQLRALGDVPLAVPEEALEAIERAFARPSPALAEFALRG